MKTFVVYLIVMVNISGKYCEAQAVSSGFRATTNYTEHIIVTTTTTLTVTTTPTVTVGSGYGPRIVTYSKDSVNYLTVLIVAGGACLLTSIIFYCCGCLCGCCCLCCCQKCRPRHHRRSLQNNASDKTVQVPSPQTKRPKPPRPPPPIYEYVPSIRPSDKVKEQNIEKKASESEEQQLDTPVTTEANKQDLDIKLNMNEGQNFDLKSNENSEQDLEMEENKAYCPTQEFIDVTSST